MTIGSHPRRNSALLIARNRAAEEIVRAQLQALAARYGTRTEAPPSGRWLTYHNATHTKEVHDAGYATAQRLAARGMMNPADVPLARIDAAFHDDEQDLGSGANEAASARTAVGVMTDAPYRDLFFEADLARVNDAIMATVVTFDGNGKLSQSVQSSGDADSIVLQKVMADADLDSLGRRNGLHQALMLHLELQSKGDVIRLPSTTDRLSEVEPDFEGFKKFLAGQQRLFGGHRYQLDDSNELLGAQQEQNAVLVESFAKRYRDGEPFGRLLESAVAYGASLETSTGLQWRVSPATQPSAAKKSQGPVGPATPMSPPPVADTHGANRVEFGGGRMPGIEPKHLPENLGTVSSRRRVAGGPTSPPAGDGSGLGGSPVSREESSSRTRTAETTRLVQGSRRAPNTAETVVAQDRTPTVESSSALRDRAGEGKAGELDSGNEAERTSARLERLSPERLVSGDIANLSARSTGLADTPFLR